ncbi:aminotransferase class V-fold PLP-dependent enzyme [Candidatus Bathyarchaeota archaeon]|nr:aminotransferase class V-fold PLP-dependent enzyme [Candidatus Bathyarchaeota archaeon]
MKDRDLARVYLDHGATTPVHPEVLNAMIEVYKGYQGNPSSLHETGLVAAEYLEASRETIATVMGTEPGNIVFTGSGTEADNMAIQGVILATEDEVGKQHVITSSIEHPAVLSTCKFLERKGIDVTFLPVNEEGIVDPVEMQEAITPRTVLISIMHANNEIGTVQPIEEMSKISRDAGVIFHTDAVQSFGKIPLPLDGNGVHLLSASAHKIYGPKGVGLLYMANGGMEGDGKPWIKPILHGGGHEHGLRPATENTPGIAGFAKAAEIAFTTMESEMARERDLRDMLIDRVLEEIPESHLNGHRTKRLPNNANFSFKGVEGESLLMRLSMAGYDVSTGSACSSKSNAISHVLEAIGLPGSLAQGSLRVTIGRSTTKSMLKDFTMELEKCIGDLRAMSPLWEEK